MSAPPAPVRAYVGLGANLGDLQRTLQLALGALEALPETQLVAVSPTYRSAPVDADGPDYLNAVAALDTRLTPHPLLDALQAIEAAHGRNRSYINAPRTLDLDLLLYADVIVRDERLTLPHPRLHQRAFALRPLHDLAPELWLPDHGPVARLLAGVADQRLERTKTPLAPLRISAD